MHVCMTKLCNQVCQSELVFWTEFKTFLDNWFIQLEIKILFLIMISFFWNMIALFQRYCHPQKIVTAPNKQTIKKEKNTRIKLMLQCERVSLLNEGKWKITTKIMFSSHVLHKMLSFNVYLYHQGFHHILFPRLYIYARLCICIVVSNFIAQNVQNVLCDDFIFERLNVYIRTFQIIEMVVGWKSIILTLNRITFNASKWCCNYVT